MRIQPLTLIGPCAECGWCLERCEHCDGTTLVEDRDNPSFCCPDCEQRNDEPVFDDDARIYDFQATRVEEIANLLMNKGEDVANVTVTKSSDEIPASWGADREAARREIRRLKTDIKLYAMGAAGVGYIVGLIMGFIGGAIAS